MNARTRQRQLALYTDQSVTTAGPAQLVSMLFAEAQASITRAVSALATADIERSHRELLHAQDVVSELASGLDLDRGGDVARSVGRLYEFCLHGLVQANLTKDAGPLDAVSAVIDGLQSAWDVATAQTAAA